MKTRGQMTVIGYALLIAITISTMGIVLFYGGQSIAMLQDRAVSERNDLHFRTAMHNINNGQHATLHMQNIYVQSDSTHIEVIYYKSTGVGPSATITPVTVIDRDMGRIASNSGYVFDAGTILHTNRPVVNRPATVQKYGNTLQLNLIDITGSGSASGTITLAVDESSHNLHSYGVLRGENVTFRVTSEYADEWESYLRSETPFTIERSGQTVTAVALIKGPSGTLEMPADDNSVRISPLRGTHPLNNLEVTIYPDDTDSARFNNLKWSLQAEDGNSEIEIFLRKGGNVPGRHPCKKRYVDVTVYFDKNGKYQVWHKENFYEMECYDRDGDGKQDEVRLTANLTTARKLEYGEAPGRVSNDDNPDVATFDSSPRFEGHSKWEPIEYTEGETEQMNRIIGHYSQEHGDFIELTVRDFSGSAVNEDTSTITIHYDGGDSVIKYLLGFERETEITIKG